MFYVLGLMFNAGCKIKTSFSHRLFLNALAQMAQLAWCQGDDLWGEDNNRLLRGFEYWCTYNLGHEDLYYEPEVASDGSRGTDSPRRL